MAKYKLLVHGWGMEGLAHKLTSEEVTKLRNQMKLGDYESLSELYSELPDLLDDFDHSLPNWWMASRPYVNDRLEFTLVDENNHTVWTKKWDELTDVDELNEKYGLPENFYESTEVLDAYPFEGQENILCIIEDVKGTICNYIIESDEVPQFEDFGFNAHSLESPEFDYEYMDKMFYKNQELEKDFEDEYVNGKSLDVYLFTLDDVEDFDDDDEEE